MRTEMPTLLTWQSRMADEMTAKGYVETILGWRGYFPMFWSPVQRDQAAALREMANFPIQGSAAGIVKKLMILADLWAPTYGAVLVSTVHDEVVYECPEGSAAAFSMRLEEIGAFIGEDVGLSVPLKLNVEIGPSWGHVQDWNDWVQSHSPSTPVSVM
jgi:DNA polymerase-1